MELGSEFNLTLSELSYTEDNFFSYLKQYEKQCIFVDSGRSAIKIIQRDYLVNGEILLPEFICESVIKCFPVESVKFYKITDEFVADVDDIKEKISGETKAIFLMHYFGAIQPPSIIHRIKEVASENELVIIEDMTHSLFSKYQPIGDYLVASIRKWMPIPCGGILLCDKGNSGITYEKYADNSKVYGMVLKDLYLRGELDCNPLYRKIFTECEEKLDVQKEIYRMSDFSQFVLGCIGISTIIKRRKKILFS